MTMTTAVELSSFELFRQGAEAKLYRGVFLGVPAVAKVRFSKAYRHPLLDRQLTRERTRGEARAMVKCKTVGVRTPTLLLADVETDTIVMEMMDGLTCRDFINSLTKEKETESLQEFNLRQEKLNSVATELGRVIGRLHSSGIIHGDLTTSNVIVQENNGRLELVLIDFGLGFSEGTPEDKGVDLYVLERAFLSTHPNHEELFKIILGAYRSEMLSEQVSSGAGKKAKSATCDEVMRKYEEIRLRGRKRTMVG